MRIESLIAEMAEQYARISWENLIFTHKQGLLTGALGAMLLISVTACTPLATNTPLSGSATPTPPAGATGTDLLPSLDGVNAEASAGWTTTTCGDLSFAHPADWDFSTSASNAHQKVFTNSALVVLEGEGDPGILPASIRVNCDEEQSPWNGETDASDEFLSQDVEVDDVQFYRLDVPGAEHAAVWVAPETGTGSSTAVDPGQTFTSAQILAVAPDGRYFTVFIALPSGNASNDVIRGVASSLSVD
jgi:hypothetical protein